MGLFNIFKKNEEKPVEQVKPRLAPSVSDEEKKYYNQDEYYQTTLYEGSMFERTIPTFEERKKTSIPSERGLYVPEILLLQYCTYGKYPHPNKYPGFWWLSYGIRDVTEALKSLEERGFIQYGSPKDSLQRYTVAELKALLEKHALPNVGKKADLINKIKDSLTDSELLCDGIEPKYILTELGKMELDDNAYVPYMHSLQGKTIEGCDNEFNIWSINRLLGTGSKVNWEKRIEEEKARVDRVNEEKRAKQDHEHKLMMEELKDTDPERYRMFKELDDQLSAQDEQLHLIQATEKKLEGAENRDELIEFWENLWKLNCFPSSGQ